MTLRQWVIVRQNCETYVAWAETKELALKEFHDRGYHDDWRILVKGRMEVAS
jgi:hypothetical protein